MKVCIALSGGIDSFVAALLLKNKGYELSSFTFLTKYTKINSERISRIIDYLKIPHEYIDISNLFYNEIIAYFLKSYQVGLTPNPCIVCNQKIKFGYFYDYFKDRNFNFIATGHYINIKENRILKGIDNNKDQSYFLCMINREIIPHIISPLGELTKKDVYNYISQYNINFFDDYSESQDVCFIKNDYRDFLIQEGIKENKGDFIYNGKVIGKHKGIPFYTFGQRRGLNVATGNRIFINKFDVANNKIILGNIPESDRFKIKNLNILNKDLISGNYEVVVRYRSKPINCKINILNDKEAIAYLDKSYPLITPGQFAAIYKDDILMGGGEISLDLNGSSYDSDK